MSKAWARVKEQAANFRIALRAALGSVGAVEAARLLHLTYPLYALIAAVIVADISPQESRRLGWRRLGGTAFGAAVGALLALYLGTAWWVIGLGVLATMCACYLAGFKGAARVAGYVTGVVLVAHSQSPWGYAAERFLETILGIGCTLLAGLIV